MLDLHLAVNLRHLQALQELHPLYLNRRQYPLVHRRGYPQIPHQLHRLLHLHDPPRPTGKMYIYNGSALRF